MVSCDNRNPTEQSQNDELGPKCFLRKDHGEYHGTIRHQYARTGLTRRTCIMSCGCHIYCPVGYRSYKLFHLGWIHLGLDTAHYQTVTRRETKLKCLTSSLKLPSPIDRMLVSFCATVFDHLNLKPSSVVVQRQDPTTRLLLGEPDLRIVSTGTGRISRSVSVAWLKLKSSIASVQGGAEVQLASARSCSH